MKKKIMPVIAKLFGKKSIGIDIGSKGGDKSVKATMHFFKGKWYVDKMEEIK